MTNSHQDSYLPTRQRVLFVDDEECLFEVITSMLVEAGFEVRSTMNAIEALEIASAFKPDVALLGLIMPHMNGIKLGLEITKLLPRIKVIITGEADLADVDLFREHGLPFDIFPHPFQKDELLAKIRK